MKSSTFIYLSFCMLLSCIIGIIGPFLFSAGHSTFTKPIISYVGCSAPANTINTTAMNATPPAAAGTISITSNAFTNNSNIPTKYACNGQGINPPLAIANIPANAKTVVLIVDDPDAPKGTFTHWMVWNIPASAQIDIKENSHPGGTEGNNGAGKKGYTGPCPPSGTHHYHFKVSALDIKLDLKQDVSKDDLEKAMANHIVASGEMIGLYSK